MRSTEQETDWTWICTTMNHMNEQIGKLNNPQVRMKTVVTSNNIGFTNWMQMIPQVGKSETQSRVTYAQVKSRSWV